MKIKIVFALVVCALLIGCASTQGPVVEKDNYITNGEFTRVASEWPNLPFNWSTTFKGGDDYDPIKTESGRFCGYAENTYSFTLYQNVTGLPAGKYTFAAEFILNADTTVQEIKMNVYSGRTLVKSLDVGTELRGLPRETMHLFELTDIDASGSVRVEFAVNSIVKTIFIDNVVFFQQK